MYRKMRVLLRLFILASLIGPAHALELAQIEQWHSTRKVPAELSKTRRDLIKETALQICTSASLAKEKSRLNTIVERHADKLDRVYRFDDLTIEQGLVMPPIILEASDRSALQGSVLRRIARSYKIAAPAQLLTRAPDWRMWLLEEYDVPEKPDQQLLPTGDKQRAVWKQACREGWQDGITQAAEVLQIKIHEMQQAFVGVIRYHLLHSLRMVSAPRIAHTTKGVRVSEGEMRIGEDRYEIKRHANFRKKNWRVLPQLPSLFDQLTAELGGS